MLQALHKNITYAVMLVGAFLTLTSQLLKSRLKMMQIYLHGILNHFSLKHPCHAINKRIIMKYFQ